MSLSGLGVRAAACLLATLSVAGCGGAEIQRPTPVTPLDAVRSPLAWAMGPDLPDGRHQATTTLLGNGEVLVAGGWNGTSSLNRCALFNPLTGQVRPAASMAVPRDGHAATLLPDGRVLVVGGQSDGAFINDSAEVYSYVDDTWTTGATAPNVIANGPIFLLRDQRLLVTGGRPIGTFLYDPALDTWTPTANQMSAQPDRIHHSGTQLLDGRILIAGGYGTGGTGLTSTQIYDAQANTWSAGPDLARGRRVHAAPLLPSGDVLIISGYDDTLRVPDSVIYDTAANAFSTPVSMRGHTYFPAALLPDGRLVAPGGSTATAGEVDVYELDATWSQGAALLAHRIAPSATLLPTGKLWIAGGNDSGFFTATTELLDPEAGRWATGGALAAPHILSTATPLPDGRVLVAGGGTRDVELFSPGSSAWSAGQRMAVARQAHTATLLEEGRVLVAGGQAMPAGDALATCELYDSATSSWRSTGTLGTGRTGHRATLLATGRVLVSGGAGPGALSSVEEFSPVTERWTAAGTLGAPRTRHTATLLPDGRVLLSGGDDGSGGVLASAEIYDPVTDTARATGSLSIARTDHQAHLLATGQVLVLGGWDGAAPLSSAELFDPATEVWTMTAPMSEARRSFCSAVLPSGDVFASGGAGSTPELGSVEIYDPVVRRWTIAPPLTRGRQDHACVGVSRGRVLVLGGSGDSTGAEIFDERGADPTRAPTITDSARTLPHGTNTPATVTGAGFAPLLDASGGNFQRSPTNYPLFLLQRLDSQTISFVPVTSWTDTTAAVMFSATLQPGWYRLSPIVNGIVGEGQSVLISRPIFAESGPGRLGVGCDCEASGLAVPWLALLVAAWACRRPSPSNPI